MTRRIAVFSGSRAEFGLLEPVIAALGAHPELECALVIAGTAEDLRRDGRLDALRAAGTDVVGYVTLDVPKRGPARAIGRAVVDVADVLARETWDFMLVYGDRFEAFAGAIAASQSGLPTAHVEGGDRTEGGALDDSVRHAITKLVHLHFPTNEDARRRILALGEEDWRVCVAGLPALDWIARGRFADADEVAARLELDLERPIVLFTQHSITTEVERVAEQLAPSLAALEQLADAGAQLVLTAPNADEGGSEIWEALCDFARERSDVRLAASLGRHLYHGVLGLARDPTRRVVCVGNSSSGLKEAPAFGCPVVNVGARQAGRLRAAGIVDVECDADAIYKATVRGLEDEALRELCRTSPNPYGDGRSGERIAARLAGLNVDRAALLRKRHA